MWEYPYDSKFGRCGGCFGVSFQRPRPAKQCKNHIPKWFNGLLGFSHCLNQDMHVLLRERPPNNRAEQAFAKYWREAGVNGLALFYTDLTNRSTFSVKPAHHLRNRVFWSLDTPYGHVRGETELSFYDPTSIVEATLYAYLTSDF